MRKMSLAILLAMSIMGNSISPAMAAVDPKLVYKIDCNSSDKHVNIGLVSDPADPSTGPEIIAFKFVLQLIPSGTTTVTDLKDAKIEKNTAYTKMIIAENKTVELSTSVEITLAGGFTDQTGVNNADDLFFLKGIDEKTYRIKVKEGEMYKIGDTNNIFNVPNDFFSVDPSICGGGTTPSGTTQTGTTGTSTGTSGTAASTVSATGTNGATTTVSTTGDETIIAISSDKSTPQGGEEVTVTALISNRKGASIDWIQTAGTQITPAIQNEELASGQTKSDLVFTMPQQTTDITLKVTVGSVDESIKISGSLRGAAEVVTAEGIQEAESLRDRLRKRREQEGVAGAAAAGVQAPTNVHAAAGGLTGSGPRETALFLFISILLALGYKKLKGSEI